MKKVRWYSRYFTAEQELEVLKLSQDHPGLTLAQLAKKWGEVYSSERKAPHLTTVRRVLHRHNHRHVDRPPSEPDEKQIDDAAETTRYQSHHRVERSEGYPSDLTNAQWLLVAPLLDRPGKRGPRAENSRKTLNAIFYIARTGCQWRYLPRDFGKWNSVAQTFYRWKKSGLLEKVHDTLREKVRHEDGRQTEPSMVILDSQSVKTTEKGGLEVTTEARRLAVVSGIFL